MKIPPQDTTGSARVLALDPSEMLTPEQAAHDLKLSTRTLAAWRSSGRHGLPFYRVGGRIRYARSDLQAWLAARQCAEPAQGVA